MKKEGIFKIESKQHGGVDGKNKR